MNDIMMDGPEPLYTLFHNLMRFRSYRVTGDVQKFYNALAAVLEDQHLKRVWFADSEDGPFEVYLTNRVNFGIKLAGSFTVTALRMFLLTSVSRAKMLLLTKICGRMVQFQENPSLFWLKLLLP